MSMITYSTLSSFKLNGIYIIGSLRNEAIVDIANKLREDLQIEVYDSWWSPGRNADDFWQDHSKRKGQNYKTALKDWHAQHVFEVDKKHLDRLDAAVLILPAGKSAHLEAGYMIGRGKPVWILMDGEPERYDIMYRFVNDICLNYNELLECIKSYEKN